MLPRTAPVIEHLRSTVVSFAVLCTLGCGQDSGPAAGEELGPCVEGYCVGELVCVRDRCVDPEQAEAGDTEGSGGESDEDSPSATSSEEEDSEANRPTDEPWCTAAAPTHCLCGRSEVYDSPDTPCSPEVIPGPAICCGTPGWPNGEAACHCTTHRCWDNGAECSCGPDQGNNEYREDTIVESCQALTEGTCCLDGNYCRCTDRTECGDLGDPVEACDAAQLTCFEGTELVDACNP